MHPNSDVQNQTNTDQNHSNHYTRRFLFCRKHHTHAVAWLTTWEGRTNHGQSMTCDAEFHLVEVILRQIHHMTWHMTVVWLDYILSFTFRHWAILYRCFAIMCFWGIATNWRGVSDEEKWRYEKWERELIIWTSRASPQELMYTICLLALIYAQSLQHWFISRSTARHVCMAPRSKPYSSAPFPWKLYENGRTCYVTSPGASTH